MTTEMEFVGIGDWAEGWSDRPVRILDSETISRLVGSVWSWMVGGTRITDRDVEMLTWMGRHGVVTPQQIGRRFFIHEGQVAQKRAYRRLAKLEELGLIRRDTPFARHPDVLRLRSRGAALTKGDLPPARFVLREIPHELAVVDLVEELLAKNGGATLQTGREVRRQRVSGRRYTGPSLRSSSAPDRRLGRSSWAPGGRYSWYRPGKARAAP